MAGKWKTEGRSLFLSISFGIHVNERQRGSVSHVLVVSVLPILSLYSSRLPHSIFASIVDIVNCNHCPPKPSLYIPLCRPYAIRIRFLLDIYTDLKMNQQSQVNCQYTAVLLSNPS